MYKPLPKGARIIFAEYDKGTTSIEELSKKTGYAKGTIYGYLYAFGKTNQRNICFNKMRISNKTRQIIEHINNGERGVDIAKKFGVTRQWVSKIKKYKMERLNND
jgi:transposase